MIGARGSAVFNVTLPRCQRCPVKNYSTKPINFFEDSTKKAIIDEIIRVNQAGEYGALRIYEGQMDVLRNTQYGPIIDEMKEQERVHLAYFDKAIRERNVRPTLLTGVWDIAGYTLGYVSAALSYKSAMTCTQAVEEVITEHYNDQIRTLLNEYPEEDELRNAIKRFRDDEQHHHDTAIENDSQLATFHSVLYEAIKLGTRAAVAIASKI